MDEPTDGRGECVQRRSVPQGRVPRAGCALPTCAAAAEHGAQEYGDAAAEQGEIRFAAAAAPATHGSLVLQVHTGLSRASSPASDTQTPSRVHPRPNRHGAARLEAPTERRPHATSRPHTLQCANHGARPTETRTLPGPHTHREARPSLAPRLSRPARHRQQPRAASPDMPIVPLPTALRTHRRAQRSPRGAPRLRASAIGS